MTIKELILTKRGNVRAIKKNERSKKHGKFNR